MRTSACPPPGRWYQATPHSPASLPPSISRWYRSLLGGMARSTVHTARPRLR